MLAKIAVTVSLILAGAGVGTAMAADEAKPTAPLLSDVLDASGITATGYVDATFSYANASATSTDSTNTFGLNQVGFTLAKLPSTGFGATVSVAAGTEAGNGLYAPSYSYAGAIGSSTTFDVLQAYAQYSTGAVTVMAGKLLTLAGAEVAVPTGNTNVTRSYLFWYSEPINHTGVRAAFVASDTATFTLGVNEGWNVTSASGKDKTYEAALTLAPSKTYTLVAAAYYGDVAYVATESTPAGSGKKMLLDVVSTWVASDKLTVVGSIDYNTQKDVAGTSYKWWGAAAYVNYAIDDAWRVSVRGEYLDDQDGFATGVAQKLKEGTATFGFAPSKNFELRLEGRYDAASTVTADKNVTQAWVAAVYKF